MKLIIDNIILTPGQPDSDIKKILSADYNLDYINFKIIRKSLDARKKNRIVYRCRIVINAEGKLADELLKQKEVSKYFEKKFPDPIIKLKNLNVIIVGSGPAGLFSALRLIKAGAVVSVFERGKPVDERLKDINIMEKSGRLETESNVLFGEGGAGTYSDGKLTTRINRPEIDWFYKTMIESGAPHSISCEANPHLGSDTLKKIIKNIRARIINSGSKIYFNERVDDIIIRNNRVKGIITSMGKEYLSSIIILATGHSARDVYELLHKKKIPLEKKNFAVGVRVEHPVDLINNTQYGKSKYRNILPAASYFLTSKNNKTGRGTYSFCMCPGGFIINSSSENNMLCTNGMSFSKRNYQFSNSAILVTVSSEDTGNDIMSGINFQRDIESKAFSMGGGGFVAPAQRVTSFLNNSIDSNLPNVSYKPGVIPGRIKDCLPKWIIDELKPALNIFNNKMNGFISSEGVLIGVETRSSSPLRILRGADFQSTGTRGLYPIGEGAGSAGGIVSSAVDGIKAADKIIELNC